MPDITRYNALNQWKLLPLSKAQFYFDDGDTIYSLEYLVKGSYASLVPVYSTRKSDKGGNHIAAFKLSVKAISSQSNIADFQAFLYAIKNQSIYGMTLHLMMGEWSAFQENQYILVDVQGDSSHLVKDISASFELNYKEEHLGLEINIDAQALLSTDILNDTNFSELITQSWG